MTFQPKSTGLFDEFVGNGKNIFIYLLLKARIPLKYSFDVDVAMTLLFTSVVGHTVVVVLMRSDQSLEGSPLSSHPRLFPPKRLI